MSPLELRDEEEYRRRQRQPGTVRGIWVLVLIDMSAFGVLFLSYVMERAGQASVFNESQTKLTVNLGLVNLVVLLTSSWFVVLALHAARAARSAAVVRYLALAFACGAAFLIIKVVEYTRKFDAGIDLLTNDYFTFYFVLTGLHALHVTAGLVILAIMTRKARGGGYGPQSCSGLESGAIYWHMVDLLWVMIFPLLYLAR